MANQTIPATESTDGLGIIIVGTDTSTADLIHTAVAGVEKHDKVYLYAANEHTADVLLSIEWGETTNPINYLVPANKGLHLVLPGIMLQNAKTVKAFAAVTGKIKVVCEVDRGE